MGKIYIVDWYNKTRNGAWRDYRKVVETDDIESYVKDKMKLAVGVMAHGTYKGTFSSATEVVESNNPYHDYDTVEGGEYWYSKDIQIVCGVIKGHYFYDHNLKKWMVGEN